MPVTRSKFPPPPAASSTPPSPIASPFHPVQGSGGCCPPGHGTGHHAWGASHFGKKILLTLFGIFLVYAIVLVGSLIRNNLQQYYFIGKADRPQRTMSIQGEGKVTVKPDVAVTTMGVISEGATVADAQAKNTEVMNKLIGKLKTLKIDAKDMQTTNYNIYPQYNYTEKEGRKLTGYEVSQSVTIKIRDLANANTVLALAGEVGANSVSGLQFTVDDPEQFKTQARDAALAQVAKKVAVLGESLGVRFTQVVSYDESGGEPLPLRTFGLEAAMGGPPVVESGSNEVIVRVNVTFEIR